MVLHVGVLLLCHLSYIQLGKLDSNIPQPKPHLTVTCFVKLLAYIPFNVGLQFSYFQSVTKLIRDVLIMFYIVVQYYTIDQDPIYKLLAFDFFAIFALPLILEGWQANNPNCILYLIKFYSLYIPLFINQLLIHENKVAQTVFLLALLEIPSMAHSRIDKDLPEIRMDSYIFKLVQLPQQKLSILHCTQKNLNEANQIELAIACIKKINDKDEWVILKSIAVSSNSSDLNYVAQSHVLVISSCSELRIYDANSLKLLKTNVASRALKRLSFISQDHFIASLRKINNSQSSISISDSIFATLTVSKTIPLDAQPEIAMFIKYPRRIHSQYSCNNNGKAEKQNPNKYLYLCVPSDRLNCLMVVDLGYLNESDTKQQQEAELSSKCISQKSCSISADQGSTFLSASSTIFLQERLESSQKSQQKTQNQGEQFQESDDEDQHINKTKPFLKPRKKRNRSDSFSGECSSEINLHEHLNNQSSFGECNSNYEETNPPELLKEYIIDGSAIKDILLHEHLLIISCSEKVVFFDLRLRKIIKSIFTLSFDTRVYWIKVTPKYTYFLLSNEIKAWMARQNNLTQCLEITEHYNFNGIQYILENPCERGLYIIYNNALYKQKIAQINLPTE